jgi:hypothetical protein
MLVGIPVIFILNGVSTNGNFIGSALILWTIPMSTMGLIILPKVVTVARLKRNASSVTGANSMVPSSAVEVELGSPDLNMRQRPNASSGPEMTPSSIPSGPRVQIVTFD